MNYFKSVTDVKFEPSVVKFLMLMAQTDLFRKEISSFHPFIVFFICLYKNLKISVLKKQIF